MIADVYCLTTVKAILSDHIKELIPKKKAMDRYLMDVETPTQANDCFSEICYVSGQTWIH